MSEIISMTKAAIIAVKEFMDDPSITGDGLRVGIKGGGCAGFEYILDFSTKLENDFVQNVEGINVYIDQMSAIHLEGTTIDYVATPIGAGFKFKNGLSTYCSCGKSFS